MKITTLIENQAPDSLCREHGLAVHMEYKGKNYLLDTGASGQYVEMRTGLASAFPMWMRPFSLTPIMITPADTVNSFPRIQKRCFIFKILSEKIVILTSCSTGNTSEYRRVSWKNIEAALDLCQVRQRQSPVSGQFHTTFPDFRKGAAAGTCILRQKTVSGLMISATNRVSSLNANMILCCSTAVAMRVLFLSLMKSIMP